jgi:hypothetical protein
MDMNFMRMMLPQDRLRSLLCCVVCDSDPKYQPPLRVVPRRASRPRLEALRLAEGPVKPDAELTRELPHCAARRLEPFLLAGVRLF